jgi:hypothetical protein
MNSRMVGLVLLMVAFFSLNNFAQPGKGKKVQEFKAIKLTKNIASAWSGFQVDAFKISNGILRPTQGNRILYLLTKKEFQIGSENEDFSVNGNGEKKFPGGARFTCNGCGSCNIKEVKNGNVTHYICEDDCNGDCNGTVSVPDDIVAQVQTASGEWHDLPKD